MQIVLGLFAHPDDEVILAGGTLAVMGTEDGLTHVRFLTDGVGPYCADARDARLDEMRQSAVLLKLSSVAACPYFIDQQLHLVPEPKLCRTIEEWLDAIAPAIVLTHSQHDLNQDHRVVSAAVMVAARRRNGVRMIYGGEGDWPSHFDPNLFTTIDGGWHAKRDALACYKSQHRAWPDPRSEYGLQGRAVRWGPYGQGYFAEAWETLWGR